MGNEIFESVAEQMVYGSLLRDSKNREADRQNAVYNRIRMLDDDYLDQVQAKVKSFVSADTWSNVDGGLKVFANKTVNIYKTIINDLSMVYKNSAIRTFGDSKGNDSKAKEIYKKMKIDIKMKKVNKYLNALNDVVIQIVPRDGLIDMDILTPNVLTIIPRSDDPTQAEAVLIKKMINPTLLTYEGNYYYTVWTETEHYMTDAKFTVKEPIGNNIDMINPYKRLPFVFLHLEPTESFWNETLGSDLVEMNVLVGAKQTLQDYNETWHNFKQLTIATDNNVTAGLTRSVDKAIIVPSDASVEVLDYGLKLKELQDALINYAGIVASGYGVSIQSLLTVTAESGIKLKIKQSKLEELRDTQIQVLEQAEKEIFDLINVIMEINNQGNIGSEFSIKYTDMKVYTDPKEDLAVLNKEIQMNLKSIIDVFMERNPTYTDRKKALSKVLEIVEENNQVFSAIDQSIMDSLNSTDTEKVV